MKKKVLTIASGLILIWTSVAAAAEGYYLGAMLGINFLNESDWSIPGMSIEAEYNAGLTAAGFFGYDFGALRAEAEVGCRTAELDQFSFLGVGVPSGGDVTASSFMINGYYDFENPSLWIPYVGVGIGAANVEIENVSIAGIAIPGSEDDTQFAYQIILGLGYSINQNWMADINYRYFATTDLELDDVEVEYNAHNLLMSFRYNF